MKTPDRRLDNGLNAPDKGLRSIANGDSWLGAGGAVKLRPLVWIPSVKADDGSGVAGGGVARVLRRTFSGEAYNASFSSSIDCVGGVGVRGFTATGEFFSLLFFSLLFFSLSFFSLFFFSLSFFSLVIPSLVGVFSLIKRRSTNAPLSLPAVLREGESFSRGSESVSPAAATVVVAGDVAAARVEGSIMSFSCENLERIGSSSSSSTVLAGGAGGTGAAGAAFAGTAAATAGAGTGGGATTAGTAGIVCCNIFSDKFFSDDPGRSHFVPPVVSFT